MNHGNDKTRIQNPKIARGKHHVCIVKTIRVLSSNQQILDLFESHHYHMKNINF